MSGPGRIVSEHNAIGIWGRLSNFEVGSPRLKTEHTEFLGARVAPLLRNNGSLRLIGLASRTGNRSANQTLSQQRVESVSNFLKSIVPTPFVIARFESGGEDQARYAGIPDGQEHENWRSVIFSAWSRPTPPPPPPPPPPLPVSEVANRIVRRTWIGPIRPDNRFLDEHEQDAERWAQAGESAMRATSPDSCEQTPEIRNIPVVHLVNVIRLTMTTEEGRFMGVTAASMRVYTISYEWGVPRPNVEFFEFSQGHRFLSREEARPWIERPGPALFRRINAFLGE